MLFLLFAEQFLVAEKDQHSRWRCTVAILNLYVNSLNLGVDEPDDSLDFLKKSWRFGFQY